jgi:hypothetical protein
MWGWVIFLGGCLVGMALFRTAYMVGYAVGASGRDYYHQRSDSLERVVRDGICVRLPGSSRCEWRIPRDTVRGTR